MLIVSPEYSAPQQVDGPPWRLTSIRPGRKRILQGQELLFNYFRGGQIDLIKIIPTHCKVVRISIAIFWWLRYPMRGNAFINAGPGGPDRPWLQRTASTPHMLMDSMSLGGGYEGSLPFPWLNPRSCELNWWNSKKPWRLIGPDCFRVWRLGPRFHRLFRSIPYLCRVSGQTTVPFWSWVSLCASGDFPYLLMICE